VHRGAQEGAGVHSIELSLLWKPPGLKTPSYPPPPASLLCRYGNVSVAGYA